MATPVRGLAHSDLNVIIHDDADPTKELKFQLSTIATGTIRTITVPDANVTLSAGTTLSNLVEDTTPQLGGALDTNSQTITGSLLGTNANAYAGLDEAASATNPTLAPDRTDLDTGIGTAGADILSLVAGGVEGHKIIEATTIQHDITGIIVHSDTVQTMAGAGAVDLVTSITHVVTDGVDALTLADGAEGQEKFIVMKTDLGIGTLTPDNLGNGTTITFDDVGDSANLLFTNAAWHFMGGTATLA